MPTTEPKTPSSGARQGHRPPSMREVARLAQVSQKTVSRVVNGEPHVSEEARDRVLRAARELGFRPNTAARALLQGRFRRIGVVSLGTALYGPSSLLFALERAASAAGYSFSVVTTLSGDPAGIAGAVDSLLNQGVDGIVLSEPIDEGEAAPLDPGVPVLSFGRLPALGPGTPGLVTGADGVGGGLAVTRHLLSLGHATVWHVAGPSRWWAARDRMDGWRKALEEAGAPEPEWIEGDWSPASGYEAGRRLARTPGVTAVFAANDDMAIGVMRGLSEAGLSVPEQVSVVGYDDIPSAAYLSPPLTTVSQDFDAVAAYGLELLAHQMETPDAPLPARGDPPARLVIRRSSERPGRP
ncbi:LacI family DNA-binding transcriptional regulator [Streptomyces sp. NPDC021098]|uniref:LacI family DNA-binding transcriptional regulator n=1 Tax=unclassified Streptomyces TaxID=2593676 RepID=UPI0037932770